MNRPTDMLEDPFNGYFVRAEPSALLAGSFETLSSTSATATRSAGEQKP